MKIRDIEPIYRVYDSGDNGYTNWYGTAEDIIEYLEENKEQIPNYDKDEGFIKNLEKYGLNFEIINR